MATSVTTNLSVYEELKVDVTAGEIPPHAVGVEIEPFDDERRFRFAKNGAAALARGKLCVAATEEANHINLTVAAAAAVGDKSVTVTLGATQVAADDYAQGYLYIETLTGSGQTYRIRGHTAAASAASLTVELYDELRAALDTTSTAHLLKHPYDGVVISVTDQLDLPVGVPPIAVTASTATLHYYFWLQVAGPCAVLADEAFGKGAALTTGTGTAGAVEALDAAGEPQIGVAMIGPTDGDYTPVMLRIA